MFDPQYFVGKYCTIFTHPINRNFTEEENIPYFVGLVRSIDREGVAVENVGKMSFFPRNWIVGISEEHVAEEEDFEPVPTENTPQIIEEAVGNSPFIDIETIKNMVKQAKKI